MRHGSIVLVHGAWTGSWVWREVAPLLRAQGFAVSAVTLTGSGERRASATPATGLKENVDDVVAHIEMEGLDNVTLVGWSYGGIVATGVADALPVKISHLCYLDAFVADNGSALVDYLAPEGRAAYEESAARNEPIPPLPLELFGLTNKAASEFIAPRLTPQPWRTFFEPARLTGASSRVPKSYILCSGPTRSYFEGTYNRMQDTPGVRTTIIEGDHFSLLTDPGLTATSIITSVPF
jgi:pimeloyl-ACP methyl ester carboxylesterase